MTGFWWAVGGVVGIALLVVCGPFDSTGLHR
jgi:hypothetical protein